MSTIVRTLNAKCIASIAAFSACAVLSASVHAKSHEVIDKLTVSTAGLDLRQPADARKLFSRIEKAADILCTRGMRVGLEPVQNYAACYEKALGDAVRSAQQPMLSMIYLETHTPDQAAAHGIEIPARIAAN